MANTNNTPPPYDLKLEHELKHEPEAKDFSLDVTTKIFKQGSDDPLLDASFSSTVDEFIWEDEDCPEKVALSQLLVNAGINDFEAQFLLIDVILYVNHKTLSLDKDYKGVFTLLVEVRLPHEVNRSGLEQVQDQKLQEPVEVSVQSQSQDIPEPVKVQVQSQESIEVNQVGSEQTTQSQELVAAATKTRGQWGRRSRLKPRGRIQKARYKMGPDGYSMVLVESCNETPVQKLSQNRFIKN